MDVKEVVWAESALSSLEKIAWYIEKEFGKKHADKWVGRVMKSVSTKSRSPYIFPKTNKNGIRRAVITPNTQLFFRIGNEILIVHVGDSRNQLRNQKYR